ncbi:MAG TPA: PadR family transcriptional regulator [Solirubrobacteraceae bacterium]|nr:PadR family transcriptional regulator [Solirubrobacteraceae bacterium]
MERNKVIKLTSTSYAVLSLLDVLGEATPYDLKQALEASVENFWPVPHTTFYEEPQRLARAGYLSVRQEPGGRRRKRYSLTPAGRGALRGWADSPEVAPPQLRDEAMLKIFAGADPRPILERRATWTRAKLAELEGYLQALQAGQDGPREDKWRGAEATLIAGIAYHRQLLDSMDEYLTGARSDERAGSARGPRGADGAAQAATVKPPAAGSG